MRKVITVWAYHKEYFLDEICLLESAKWHHKLNVGRVDVLVLEGFNIVNEFKDELESYGYFIHDGSHVYKILSTRYDVIKKYYPNFHFANFMRWLAIDMFFNESSYMCFDADLVISSSICQEEELKSSTFTSSSTCFVVINNKDWFSGYRQAMEMFNDDMGKFQDIWNKEEGQKIKGADDYQINEETFVRFLIKTNRIPNLFPKINYYVIPFLIELYNNITPNHTIEIPITYKRIDGKFDYFNENPLAFVHFQRHFVEYLSMHLMYKYALKISQPILLEPSFGIINKTARRPDIISLNHKNKDLCISGIFGNNNKDLFKRRRVMQEFLFKNDLSEVFSNFSWHIPNIFK